MLLWTGSWAGKAEGCGSSCSRRRRTTRQLTAMAIGLLGRKVGMTQIFDEAGNVDAGHGDPGRARATCCSCARSRARRLRGRAIGLSATSPAALPAAAPAATLPSSTASGSGPRARPASSRSPRPIASRSGSSANSAAPSRASPVGQEIDVDIFAEVKRRRRDRHHQGPRHRRRDEAAQLPRPAGLARREESASPRRLDRLQHQFPATCFKGRRMAGQYGNARSTMRNLQGRADRRREQPAAGARRRAGPQRRLRGDHGNEQTVGADPALRGSRPGCGNVRWQS